MSEKIEIKGTSFAELKQGFDICNDANFTDKYAQYTSTNKKKKNIDLERVPFNRYLDLWWVSFLVGVANGHSGKLKKKNKFADGLQFEEWQRTLIRLIAMQHHGSEEVLQSASSVADIANSYAAGGFLEVLDILDKETRPMWKISKLLEDLHDSEGQLL